MVGYGDEMSASVNDSGETKGCGHKPLGWKYVGNLLFKLPQSACHVRLGEICATAEVPFGGEQIREKR